MDNLDLWIFFNSINSLIAKVSITKYNNLLSLICNINVSTLVLDNSLSIPF